MKVRQSASLVAGVCTLCVAASTSVTPVAGAAATPSPIQRPVELTAASGAFVDGINAVSQPLQNFVTLLNAIAGAAGGSNGTGGGGASSLQALPNLLYSQLVAGTLTEASATTAINAALATEEAALANLGFGSLGAAMPFKAAAVKPAVAAAVPQAGLGSAVDIANVASLPLQNGITALNALAGAAGGGNGVGGGGATSFQALPNLLYSQLVAGTLTQGSATTAFNAAVATEQTALNNLAATPGKIIATDIAALQKLGLPNASATSFTNKVAATDTVTKPKAAAAETNTLTATMDTVGSTTQPRHAAKSNDNNPVSSAIKAIKEASKGSYVGKHRADSGGSKSSGADNASKGSDEK